MKRNALTSGPAFFTIDGNHQFVILEENVFITHPININNDCIPRNFNLFCYCSQSFSDWNKKLAKISHLMWYRHRSHRFPCYKAFKVACEEENHLSWLTGSARCPRGIMLITFGSFLLSSDNTVVISVMSECEGIQRWYDVFTAFFSNGLVKPFKNQLEEA